jgi:hypothetical protein
MATFILVHGTFARAAHWPALREGLAQAASAVGEHCRFEEVRWSGKNRASARQGAGAELFSVVQKIHSTLRNEEIFVIGHSHGGSAIAYFLKEHSSLAATLSGCAFLSTPFVAIRPRSQAIPIFTVLYFVTIYAFSALYPYAYVRLFGGGYLSDPLLYPSLFFLLAALVWFFYRTSREYRNSEKLLAEAHRRQTADLPPGNYLFLRCSGDEAAALLSAAQLIAWISMKLSQILELIIRPALSGTRKGAIAFILFGFIATWWTSFESPDDRNRMISLYHAAGEGHVVLSWLISILIGCFRFGYYLLIASAVAVFLILLAQALTSWLFGWTELSTGLFVELAIEPVPFGAHSMTHIDWNSNPPRLGGITHSWTYSHPAAIQYIGDWVVTALQRPPN